MATQPALRVDRIWLTGPGRHFLLPITIPADQSITGKEITIEPTSEQETLVSPDDTPESHLHDLIAKGKACAEHFAIVFREIPGLTEAQAIEQGIRPLT